MALADIGGGTERYYYKELKTRFRDFKLKVITDDITFNLKSDIDDSDLKFIIKTFPNDIITGSTALMLYGLMNRTKHDIDIIIDNPDRYNDYRKGGYHDDELLQNNRLGYKIFKFGSIFKKLEYQVDFFYLHDDISYNEFNVNGSNIKLQDPIQIMDRKFDMVKSNEIAGKGNSETRKHYSDLIKIFNKF